MYEYPNVPAPRRRNKGGKTVRRKCLHRKFIDGEVPLVVTITGAAMRARLDAAQDGLFTTFHASSVAEASQALSTLPARAMLVAPAAITSDPVSAIATLVARFPQVLPVTVVGDEERAYARQVMDLGRCGVRHLVDLTNRQGWSAFRTLLSDNCSTSTSCILQAVMSALGEASVETRQFFVHLVRTAPHVATARLLAQSQGIPASTLMSRFYRAGLPSPKYYLARMRLLYAAALFETPGLSTADVAYRLGFSSPQSFGRHVRCMFSITTGDLRRSRSFSSAIDDFVNDLLVPFHPTIQNFDPYRSHCALTRHDAFPHPAGSDPCGASGSQSRDH